MKKKFILTLLLLLLLTGCKSKEVKTFQAAELETICQTVYDLVGDEAFYLGLEDGNEDSSDFNRNYDELRNKYLAEYKLQVNDKVRVTGKLDYIMESDKKNVAIVLNGLECRMKNTEVLKIREGSLITIEGILYKTGEYTTELSDCKLIKE